MIQPRLVFSASFPAAIADFTAAGVAFLVAVVGLLGGIMGVHMEEYNTIPNNDLDISAKFTLNSKRFPRLKSTFPL
jgi:hypothetical protein